VGDSKFSFQVYFLVVRTQFHTVPRLIVSPLCVLSPPGHDSFVTLRCYFAPPILVLRSLFSFNFYSIYTLFFFYAPDISGYRALSAVCPPFYVAPRPWRFPSYVCLAPPYEDSPLVPSCPFYLLLFISLFSPLDASSCRLPFSVA